jgi:hypothetical protein
MKVFDFVIKVSLCVCAFSVAFFPSSLASAKIITEIDASVVVKNWLMSSGNHFNEKLGTSINKIKLYTGEVSGEAGYYYFCRDRLLAAHRVGSDNASFHI